MRGVACGAKWGAVALAMMLPTLADADGFEPKAALVCVTSHTGGLVELGSAFVVLNAFLNANSGPYGTTYRVAERVSAYDYLTRPAGAVTIQCGGSSAAQQTAAAGSGAAADEGVRHFFGIRKNVDDFQYAQDSPEFQKLERANLSFKEDYIADNKSFGIEGVAGYTLGPAPIGRSFMQITPFVSYKEDKVNKKGQAQDQGVYNLGGGVVGDLLFPIGRFYQDLQIYPQYVHSFADDANTLITNLVYTPEPAGRSSAKYATSCPMSSQPNSRRS